MTTSILLRPPPLASPGPSPSPSPSPSPVSTPLPTLQADLTSSSSSSTSESYLDRPPSAPCTRRIRFAPLPEPDRDLLLDPYDPSSDVPQPDPKSATQPVPPADDLHDDFIALSPTVSPDSTGSSVRSTPTIRSSSATPSKNTQKSTLKLFRPFSFFRRVDSSNIGSSPVPRSASLPSSRNASLSSLPRFSSSVPNIPSIPSAKLPRISTDDILSFGRKSLFRNRSGSSSSTPPPRTSSPPPKRSGPSKSRLRSTFASPEPAMKPVDRKRDWGEGFSQPRDSAAIPGSGSRTRRASTSAATPGAGGGRHTSVKMLSNASSPRPSTAPNSPVVPPKKHVKMLNGRIYGAKRYAAQTLANPFANVREEPEFVEWGYGGMGSVHASAGIGNDMWKGLQRSERGGALLAGSFDSPSVSGKPATGAGGGRGSGAHATSWVGRRRMSVDVPECGMGNVGAGGMDEDDGSGIAWLKRRRAEKEAKARLEQETKEQERKTQEKRKSGDSFNVSVCASTASTTTSLTACTSAASMDLTTPTTSPLGSRPPSMTDLKLTSSPSRSRDLGPSPPCVVTGAQSPKPVTTDPVLAPKDEHEHRILTAVRLSPNIPGLSCKLEQMPLSPVDAETSTSTNSSDDEEPSRSSDEEEEQDDVEHEVQDVKRKTALGAGVEKISRHVDVEAR